MGIKKNPHKKNTTHKKTTVSKFSSYGVHLKPISKLADTRLVTLTSAASLTSAQWRVDTIRAKFQRWPSGADETVPTRMAVLAINASKGAAKLKLARELNEYRMDNSQHIWRTSSGEIAGHVPAIKHDPNNLQSSVTTEHGTRDRLREKVVKNIFHLGKDERRIAATAATLKYFMSPGEELMTAKPSKSIFSNYNTVGDLKKPAELKKLASFQQEAREHHKIEFAEMLQKLGRINEIPNQYKGFIGQGSSTQAVRNKMLKSMEGNQQGSIVPNSSVSSQINLTRIKTSFARPLSPPRRPIK